MRKREQIRKGIQYLDEIMSFKILDDSIRDSVNDVYAFFLSLKHGCKCYVITIDMAKEVKNGTANSAGSQPNS